MCIDMYIYILMFRKLNPICWSDIGKYSIIGGFMTCCLFIHRNLR